MSNTHSASRLSPPPPPQSPSQPEPEWIVVRHGDASSSSSSASAPSASSSSSAPRILLGESPCWDPRSGGGGRLLFVDIERGAVHRLDPLTGRSESITFAREKGVVLLGAVGLVQSTEPGEDDSEMTWLASSVGLHLLCWRRGRSTLLLPNPDASDTRFNDAKVFAPSASAASRSAVSSGGGAGDLIAGTIVTESNALKRRGRGHLFLLSARSYESMGCLNRMSSQTLLRGATLSNGLDFSTDVAGQQSMHWIDSATSSVQRFQINGFASGSAAATSAAAAASAASAAANVAAASSSAVAPASPTGVVSLSSHTDTKPILTSGWKDSALAASVPGGGNLPLNASNPDGMALDSEGCLWVALNGGGAVVRCDPQGKLLRVIRFPVSKVTSVCFGGGGGGYMRSLFATSASKGVDLAKEPLAGSVFLVRDVGVAGMQMNRLRGRFTLSDASPTQIEQHAIVEDIPANTGGAARMRPKL